MDMNILEKGRILYSGRILILTLSLWKCGLTKIRVYSSAAMDNPRLLQAHQAPAPSVYSDILSHGHMTIVPLLDTSSVFPTGQRARAKDIEGVSQLSIPPFRSFPRSYTQQSLLISHWLELSDSSPPYLQGIRSKTPSGHLKLGIVWNPIYIGWGK